MTDIEEGMHIIAGRMLHNGEEVKLAVSPGRRVIHPSNKWGISSTCRVLRNSNEWQMLGNVTTTMIGAVGNAAKAEQFAEEIAAGLWKVQRECAVFVTSPSPLSKAVPFEPITIAHKGSCLMRLNVMDIPADRGVAVRITFVNCDGNLGFIQVYVLEYTKNPYMVGVATQAAVAGIVAAIANEMWQDFIGPTGGI